MTSDLISCHFQIINEADQVSRRRQQTKLKNGRPDRRKGSKIEREVGITPLYFRNREAQMPIRKMSFHVMIQLILFATKY